MDQIIVGDFLMCIKYNMEYSCSCKISKRCENINTQYVHNTELWDTLDLLDIKSKARVIAFRTITYYYD